MALALPAALNSLMDMINIVVDIMMVGRLSPESIVAVSVGMQFMMIFYVFIIMFYTGTNAVVSRYVGAGQLDKAGVAGFNLSWFGLLFAFPVLLLGLQGNTHYFGWITDDAEAVRLGIGYLDILLFVYPLMLVKMVLIAVLSAAGDTKTPLKIKLVGFFINVVFNYLLIFGKFGFPQMGVSGAAVSTCIVQLFEVAALLYVLAYRKSFTQISLIPIWNTLEIKRAMKIGFPTSFERIIMFGSMIIFSKIVADYGTAALAGYQVGLRVEGLAYMPGAGFMIASMALIGQNIGAGRLEEGESVVFCTMVIAGAIMGILGIVMLLIPETISRAFTDDAATISETAWYLRIMGVSQIPLACQFVLEGALRGAGATKQTLVINASSIILLRVIPVFAVACWSGPVIAIYVILSVETFSRAMILWTFFRRGEWKTIRV